jgi:hypothetical protein
MRSRKVALLVSLALLLGTALAAQLPSAGAQAATETTVILIEVDGLEPKDVTRETTPFLWQLAHPNAPESQLIEDSRSGWSWQAPRSVMSAGTAANAEALLTGGYPEQSGIPADEFFDPDSGETMRLEHQGDNPLPDGAFQIRNGDLVESNTLLELVAGDDTERDRDAAAFVGNPALSGIVDEEAIPNDLKWWPTNEPSQSPPSPAYCDVPRRAPDDPETEQPDPDPSYQPPCSAADLVTLDRAANQLGSQGGNVAFTYIHLAELGVIKRRDGDVSLSPETPPTDVESPEAAQSVPHQLAQTDAAIAQFIARYRDQNASPATWQKWPNTFVFVVGSHGYETSSPDKRLPAPGGQVGATDLESWVEAQDGDLKYSAYGSMATIHVDADTAARRTAVAGLVDDLKPGGSVDQACGEPCIEELLYVNEDVMPATAPDGTGLLSERHPNWRLNHLNLDDDGNRADSSRRSGELVIVTKPGWGAGAIASLGQEGLAPDPEAPDPYLGVAGGPRNRAVAAIVNGPGGDTGVRQVVPRRYPVTAANGNCQSPDPDPTPKYNSLAQANAQPEDDTEAVGHACQPENVDFAPTIGALLQVGIDSDQLGGRFLQEAFLRPLAFPGIEELEEPPPPPPPPPAARSVVVLPAPPPPRAPRPPRTWRYSGLVRNVLAAVGDRRGDLYPYVRRGASLDYLILRADFGKPLAAVKLTFYRRVKASASASRRTVVKTLATFKPFTVRRARRASLKLKVPELFEPTHVGVIVQRARPLTRAERTRAAARRDEGEDVPNFKAYGAQAGGIYRIRKAHRLHTRATRVRKPGSRK